MRVGKETSGALRTRTDFSFRNPHWTTDFIRGRKEEIKAS